ncbi:MAG: hypothetical protein WAO69_17740 [Aestuariivita sp.]|uniref:hypothetical protein n=1 Tax=Aestuariivita sp. TaxID=1872407 RepID=UPI003BB20746
MTFLQPRPGAQCEIRDRWGKTFLIEWPDEDHPVRVWRLTENGILPADSADAADLLYALSEEKMMAERYGRDLPAPEVMIWPKPDTPAAQPNPKPTSAQQRRTAALASLLSRWAADGRAVMGDGVCRVLGPRDALAVEFHPATSVEASVKALGRARKGLPYRLEFGGSGKP